MKHLTISLLIVSLCFSLLLSCGETAPAEASTEDSGVIQYTKDKNNPKDMLSKEEKLERMNAAHSSKFNTPEATNETSAMVKAKTNLPSQKIGSDQAEQSSRQMRKRYESVMNTPPSAEEKKIANDICKCLQSKPLFKTLKKAKSEKEMFKLAGEDKDVEVKDLQDCYNKNMVPAVNTLGQDAGIFAMKSRTYLNKNCLDGTDNFWIYMGSYLVRNAEKAEFEIDMPKIEAGRRINPGQ